MGARLLGTVFTMVPSAGPRAYAQYNAYYRTEHPMVPADAVEAVEPVEDVLADDERNGRESKVGAHRHSVGED